MVRTCPKDLLLTGVNSYVLCPWYFYLIFVSSYVFFNVYLVISCLFFFFPGGGGGGGVYVCCVFMYVNISTNMPQKNL